MKTISHRTTLSVFCFATVVALCMVMGCSKKPLPNTGPYVNLCDEVKTYIGSSATSTTVSDQNKEIAKKVVGIINLTYKVNPENKGEAEVNAEFRKKLLETINTKETHEHKITDQQFANAFTTNTSFCFLLELLKNPNLSQQNRDDIISTSLKIAEASQPTKTFEPEIIVKFSEGESLKSALETLIEKRGHKIMRFKCSDEVANIEMKKEQFSARDWLQAVELLKDRAKDGKRLNFTVTPLENNNVYEINCN